MRAAVIAPDGRFEVAEVPEPKPGPGELLLRVTSCGFCGSDIKARPIMPEGTIMGHEFGGEVIGVGSGTSSTWREGTHAAVLPALSCGTCDWCRSGFVIHCPQVRLVGLGGAGGGFAEFAVITEAASIPLTPRVNSRYSALVEPFAVGLHTIHTGGLREGDDVLVIGAGSVGLTTAAWAKVRGARSITVVDPVEARRDVAKVFGADLVLASVEEAPRDSYDLVAECVGHAELLDDCVARARPRSRVVVAGVDHLPKQFTSSSAILKETTLTFAVYYSPAEFETVIEAIADGVIDPAPLLAKEVPLDQVNEAFADLTASAVSGRILVTP